MRFTATDRHLSDTEWREFLESRSFGEVIGWQDGETPVVTPVHFTFSDADTMEFHLHKGNPLWNPLGRTGMALLAVTDADAYIPTAWNAANGRDPAWSAPTSYYAAVQAECSVEVISDPDDLAGILNRQLRHLQPEGGYHPVHPGSNPFGEMLSGILGGRLHVQTVHSKFKFGSYQDEERANRIAGKLLRRGGARDLRARQHLLRRLKEIGRP